MNENICLTRIDSLLSFSHTCTRKCLAFSKKWKIGNHDRCLILKIRVNLLLEPLWRFNTSDWACSLKFHIAFGLHIYEFYAYLYNECLTYLFCMWMHLQFHSLNNGSRGHLLKYMGTYIEFNTNSRTARWKIQLQTNAVDSTIFPSSVSSTKPLSIRAENL